ncbi:hypothetical protein GGI26_005288 [Coemansia sp. RSA 1358]|uniref:Peptidase S1 domain-containing protein n=1 Tax=Coemansia umbellata TaxID=1424467 RepID=A0ABQ8PJU4_9FUNG|nr:hypothetical protein EDC05_004860 [Coemansia umbellata]KAJ2620116.1 hypothetical protein GGI26_005288 [Coemansia sp. RSA 1358]
MRIIGPIACFLPLALLSGKAVASAIDYSVVPTGAMQDDMRVTNGTLSPQGEAPYFVQLLINLGSRGYGRCGGTIIGETTIVTAAHCVYDSRTGQVSSPDSVYVIHGTVRRFTGSSQSFPGTVVKATNVTAHPDYNTGTLHNDIAIIQVPALNLKNKFTEKITIFDGKIAPQEAMRIYGWGKTRTDGSSSDVPDALLKQTVFIAEPRSCQDIDSSYKNADGSQICADNNYNVGVDVCQGDSGTGTTINAGGKAYLAGLVSYGLDRYGNATCGEAGSFGMYTHIKYYLSWIESVTGKKFVAGPSSETSTPPPTTTTSTQPAKPTSSQFCIFFICF